MPDASLPIAGPAAALDRRTRLRIAACLIAVMALEVLARISHVEAVRIAAWGAAALTIPVARRVLGLREAYLLTLSLLLATLVWRLHPDPVAVLAAALDQASFLMAFILLLGLLHQAASTSPALAGTGSYLTGQPPDRRYFALYAGTGILGVLFNIGVVSFLTPLIQRGIATATPGDARNPIRERRQLSAMLRGFAWSVIWSPTAVAPLAVATLLPGADRRRWMLIGFAVFLVVMGIGALEDRIRFRAYRPTGPRRVVRFPWRSAAKFLAACLWLVAMLAVVMWVTGDTLIFGLMVACPVMLVGWIAVQNRGAAQGAGPATLARLRTIGIEDLPMAAPVAVTLACSGFVGRAGAALVPAQALAATLGLEAMPDFVLLSLLPVVLTLLSLLALSPIMTAVFFGSLFGSLPVLPADPTLIALAISCGWSLSMTVSPFSTIVLLIGRIGGIAPRTLTLGWNLGYSLLAGLALVPIFALLTGGR